MKWVISDGQKHGLLKTLGILKIVPTKFGKFKGTTCQKIGKLLFTFDKFGFGQMSFGKLSLSHNNDLPDNVFFSLALLFANDLKLICKVHDHASLHGINKLKEGVHSLHIWSDATFLCFNTKKCEYKANRRNKPGITNTAFSLGTEPIRPTSSVRDLDLIINENLDWSEHIATRVNRARKVLFLLRRNTPNLLSSESKSCLSRSNINPTLLFASEC